VNETFGQVAFLRQRTPVPVIPAQVPTMLQNPNQLERFYVNRSGLTKYLYNERATQKEIACAAQVRAVDAALGHAQAGKKCVLKVSSCEIRAGYDQVREVTTRE
jgi:hypothetical protein